eukprot:TRINITY_DN2263_c0_g1_i3.p1 TRINITY_DN2263_c0_g1~~TRINITY_DN2263_c0_g1_i3.p1  ORF type:complete len:141 (+),score=14.52 TRINITY_DN2263_c0_g1_i3:382-804(+)
MSFLSKLKSIARLHPLHAQPLATTNLGAIPSLTPYTIRFTVAIRRHRTFLKDDFVLIGSGNMGQDLSGHIFLPNHSPVKINLARGTTFDIRITAELDVNFEFSWDCVCPALNPGHGFSLGLPSRSTLLAGPLSTSESLRN